MLLLLFISNFEASSFSPSRERNGCTYFFHLLPPLPPSSSAQLWHRILILFFPCSCFSVFSGTYVPTAQPQSGRKQGNKSYMRKNLNMVSNRLILLQEYFWSLFGMFLGLSRSGTRFLFKITPVQHPDRLFHNFRASKSVDRRFGTT